MPIFLFRDALGQEMYRRHKHPADHGGDHEPAALPEERGAMRGGGHTRIPLNEDLAWVNIGSPEMLDLNRALDELGELDAGKVQVVELRYFLGCTSEETASLLHMSKATVDREMRFIKSWLYRRIHQGATEGAAKE